MAGGTRNLLLLQRVMLPPVRGCHAEIGRGRLPSGSGVPFNRAGGGSRCVILTVKLLLIYILQNDGHSSNKLFNILQCV